MRNAPWVSRICRVWIWVWLVAALAGCEYGPGAQPTAPPSPPAPPAPPTTARQSVDAVPETARPPAADLVEPRTPQPAAEPPTAPVELPPPVDSPSRRLPAPDGVASMPIRLSGGVALPQTGPTGIMMSFSVDYRFTQGGPNPAAQYVWVIRRAKGNPAAQPVSLRNKNTLRTFIPGWRPEEGPFQTFLVEVLKDGTRRPLSKLVSLR